MQSKEETVVPLEEGTIALSEVAESDLSSMSTWQKHKLRRCVEGCFYCKRKEKDAK